MSYSPNPREDEERFFEDFRNGTVKNSFLNSGFSLIEELTSYDSLSREIEWNSEVYSIS